MQQVIECDEFVRRLRALSNLRPQAIHPSDHPLIEIVMHAHGVVDAAAMLEQAREDLIDVGDRE